MAVSVNTIARQLELSPEDLLKRCLLSFLEREKRAAQMDIGDLQDRYGARSAADLRAKIERGEVYSHPAWEEAIEWEQLETHLHRLEMLLLATAESQ